MVPQQQERDEENIKIKGKDLDEESTAQNIINVARQGDISPRHIEKGKSAAKGNKKQVKDNPVLILRYK